MLGNCNSTGIGSVPFTDSKEAVDIIINQLDIPFWPQLPKLSQNENMYLQYSESLPGLKFEGDRFFIDTSSQDFNEKVESFFNEFMSNNLDYFKITGGYSKGLPELLSRGKLDFIKGQVTGPVSFGLTLVDQDRKPMLYNELYADVLVKNVLMKAKYQIRLLKQLSDNVLMFVDEPSLCYFGSEAVSLSADQVKTYLGEVFKSIHDEGALVGLHCCSNTDWGLLLNLDVDVISFDACSYADKFFIYHEDIKSFIEKGKTLAWGIVPTTKDLLDQVDVNSLVEKFNGLVETLASSIGLDKQIILKQSLITPSCGVGSLDEESARKVFDLVKQTSDFLKKNLEG